MVQDKEEFENSSEHFSWRAISLKVQTQANFRQFSSLFIFQEILKLLWLLKSLNSLQTQTLPRTNLEDGLVIFVVYKQELKRIWWGISRPNTWFCHQFLVQFVIKLARQVIPWGCTWRIIMMLCLDSCRQTQDFHSILWETKQRVNF